jgi:hypothetical protein
MRLTWVRVATISIVALLAIVGSSPLAVADAGLIDHSDGLEARVGRTESKANQVRGGAGARRASSVASRQVAPKHKFLPKDEYKQRMTAYRRQLAAAVSANRSALNARGECLSTTTTFNCGRFQTVALPDDPGIREAGDSAPAADGAPAAPAITPEQAAYIASARIRLVPPKPVIGPPPEINEWGMAAVGYPLWLWTEGNLDPAPVSDSVFDLSVSLDARLVEVVFDMGDGHRVRCSDLGTRWTRSVEPGAKSPTCGYAYQEPSLPRGSYTVTANAVWAIDWSINGSTGSIPFYQSASTQIPVGELQVLVR